MSSWTMDMIPLREVMRSTAEITARQLGLGEEFDSFAEICDEFGRQPPYPLGIDIYLARYRMGGSMGMSGVIANNDTETPVQFVSERVIEAFIKSEPGLYIFRSGSKEKIDVEKMMGYDSISNMNSDIPFKQDGILIVVPARKWEQYKGATQILSDDELIDIIGNLGPRVTIEMAMNALKPLTNSNKSAKDILAKAKIKFPHVGRGGRPKKPNS